MLTLIMKTNQLKEDKMIDLNKYEYVYYFEDDEFEEEYTSSGTCTLCSCTSFNFYRIIFSAKFPWKRRSIVMSGEIQTSQIVIV